jgi:Mrp family chromosome partitioning ATPase/uncharacterized protein involved in exopolysaccharide biosynthesis
MSDAQIVPVHVSAAGGERAEIEAASRAPAANPLWQIHLLLRGRYHWAILLAAVFAAAGAFVGYELPPVRYRSTAVVRILPNRQRILYQNEQNSVMPMFDAFVESQTVLITNPRVLNAAMQDAGWQVQRRNSLPNAEQTFRDSVEVEHPRGSEMVLIYFYDRDPAAAKAGATAVLHAFEKLYNENSSDNPDNVVDVLEPREKLARQQLELKRQEIAQKADEAGFGSSDLAPFYESQAQQYNNIRAEIQQAELLLASVDFAGSTTRPAPVLTAEAIGPFDSALQTLLHQRSDLRLGLSKLETRYGAQYQQVIDAKTTLADLDKQIDERVAAFARSASEPGAARTTAPGTVTAASVRMRLEKLHILEKEAYTALLKLGQKKEHIDQLIEQATTLRKSIDEIHTRIEQLHLENQANQRLVRFEGDLPLQPYNDKRLSASVAASAGGVALGAGLVALIGLVKRRFRSFADAQSAFAGDLRLLGIVPEVPAELKDAERASAASHCLHQIRSALQIQKSDPEERVYALTSPSPAAGKTSTTLALGLSFAAAKSKTLLIDLDVVGAGLSNRIRNTSHRRMGRIVVGEGLVTDAQLQRALAAAAKYGTRLGEVLVKAGWLSEADVNHALEVQGQSPLGLLDVMGGENLADCVTWTGVPGLFVLPVGTARAAHVGQFSPAAIRKITEAARVEFDIVLIDTGPVLGSLEASIVSAESDKVVLVLSRGESQYTAKKAMAALHDCGARLAGVVFNRATENDVEVSGYSSTRSASPASRRPLVAVRTMPVESNLHVGPLGQAVVSSTASHHQG